MVEFDLYIKRRDGKWSCRGSYPSKEMALKMKNKRHEDEEFFIKESYKRVKTKVFQ